MEKKKAEETADIAWVSISPEESFISMRFGDGDTFNVTYPEKYPDTKDEPFFVYADGDRMDAWNDAMQDHTEGKPSFSDLLTKCAEVYLETVGSAGGGEGGDDFDFDEFGGGGEFDEDGFGFKEEKTEKKSI